MGSRLSAQSRLYSSERCRFFRAQGAKNMTPGVCLSSCVGLSTRRQVQGMSVGRESSHAVPEVVAAGAGERRRRRLVLLVGVPGVAAQADDLIAEAAEPVVARGLEVPDGVGTMMAAGRDRRRRAHESGACASR